MTLLETLSQQLDPRTVEQMSQQIGADPATTQQAIATAVPLLLGGLSRNANQSQAEAQSLANALEQDHDGSVLDNLGSLLGGGGGGALLGALGSLLGGGSRATDGDGILGHILGGRRQPVETGIGRATGLNGAQVSRLLTMLAPLVMSALGKLKRQRGLDAGGLSDLLRTERQEVEQKAPGLRQGGLLSVLDMNDDGSIADDVAKLGAVLGGAAILNRQARRR